MTIGAMAVMFRVVGTVAVVAAVVFFLASRKSCPERPSVFQRPGTL